MLSHQFTCPLVHLRSSSLVYSKNDPEFITWRTAQVFIPLIRFLQPSLGLRFFLVLLRHIFLISSFISAGWMVFTSNIPKYLQFSFSSNILIYSWFCSFIHSDFSLFPLFNISMAHFSMPNSIPVSHLYILIVCVRISKSFSFLFIYLFIYLFFYFFANSSMLSMFIWVDWSLLAIL